MMVYSPNLFIFLAVLPGFAFKRPAQAHPRLAQSYADHTALTCASAEVGAAVLAACLIPAGLVSHLEIERG
jgi:hypothetical protein